MIIKMDCALTNEATRDKTKRPSDNKQPLHSVGSIKNNGASHAQACTAAVPDEGESSDSSSKHVRIPCHAEGNYCKTAPTARSPTQRRIARSSQTGLWLALSITATILTAGTVLAISNALLSRQSNSAATVRNEIHTLNFFFFGDKHNKSKTSGTGYHSVHNWRIRQTEEEEDRDNEDEDGNEKDRDDENDGEKDNEDENERADEDDEENENDNEKDDNDKDNNEQNNQGNQEEENEDDYFGDDGVADDYIHKNPHNPNIDDFYAFVDGQEQPHLFPLTEREIVGYLIASAALTLGASGGIGGGGIVVPVYLLVMGMGPKVAIPIGAVTVLGGALSSTCINWHRRHPLADRPLIDWDFILVMQPVVLIGVCLGTFIHQLLSEQILIVLLVVLLSATAHSTLSKAMRMYEAEKRYIRHLKAAQAEPPTGSPSRTFTWGDGELHTMKPTKHQVDEEEKERILIENPDFVTLRSDLMEEEKFTPNSKIMVVVCVISVLITLNIMVGGGGIESPWGIVCGSTAFWTIHAIMLGFLMVAAWSAQAHLIARHEIKNIVRFDYVHGDIRWNRRAGWLYPIVFMVAGLLAGMFGIGGGIMIVPLLLTIGTHPAVASSTSSAMVLITSLVSTSTYAVFGLILADYAVVGFFVAFFSSLVGQIIMGRLRQARSASGRAFERNSYIAFVIGGVVLVSAVLMTIRYILSIVEGPDDDYGNLCDGLTFNT